MAQSTSTPAPHTVGAQTAPSPTPSYPNPVSRPGPSPFRLAGEHVSTSVIPPLNTAAAMNDNHDDITSQNSNIYMQIIDLRDFVPDDNARKLLPLVCFQTNTAF